MISAQVLPVVERVGEYRVVGRLARGGMGEVFLAMKEGPAGFSKPVVIKRIVAELIDDPGTVEAFIREARLSALLCHPNVVQTFELGSDDHGFFLAMEYVHGASLRTLLRTLARVERVMPPRITCRIVSDALRGLHHVHTLTDDQGQPLSIVHRDVSPDNLLVAYTGAVKVTDFGVARIGSGGNTQCGQVKGKLRYMSYEQVTAATLDGRSDVYSAGAVLYEALSGQLFRSGSDHDLIRNVLAGDAARDLSCAAPVPGLERVLRTALSREREARFASAAAMADALDALEYSHGRACSADVSAMMVRIFGQAASLRQPTLEELARLATPRPTQGFIPTGPLPRPSAPASPTRSSIHEPTARLPLLAIAVAAVATLGVAAWSASPPRVREASAVRPPFIIAPLPELPAAAEAVASPAAPVVPALPAAAVPEASAPTARRAAPRPPARALEKPAEAGAAERKPPLASVEPAPPAAPAQLEVRCAPWCEVYLDGRFIGVTPMPAFSAPAGLHHLSLIGSKDFEGVERDLNLSSGERRDVRVQLSPSRP